MKIARLAGLMLVAVMALGLAVASMAFAAEPEFKPASGTATGASTTTNELVAGTNSISCTGNTTNSGTVSSATLVGKLIVTFTGCKSSSASEKGCTAKSVGATEGTIVTTTLHEVLGLILPKGTGTGVGALLLPESGRKFVTIASNKCTVETTVNGNVAGEVSPIGSKQTTGKLVLKKSETSGESIKEFDPSTGGKAKPEMEAFGVIASQETSENVTFSAALEVT